MAGFFLDDGTWLCSFLKFFSFRLLSFLGTAFGFAAKIITNRKN